MILPTAEAGVGEIARSMNACVSYARYVAMKHQTEPAANSSAYIICGKGLQFIPIPTRWEKK